MKRGFTLIELLAVSIIIAILAAIAMFQYKNIAEKTRIASGIPIGRALIGAEDLYYLKNENFTQLFDKLILGIPPGYTDENGAPINKLTSRIYIYYDVNTQAKKRYQLQPSGRIQYVVYLPEEFYLYFYSNYATGSYEEYRGKITCTGDTSANKRRCEAVGGRLYGGPQSKTYIID